MHNDNPKINYLYLLEISFLTSMTNRTPALPWALACSESHTYLAWDISKGI